MLEAKFYEIGEVKDSMLKYAVIVSRYQDKWVFCKHKNRGTWEVPGGHREVGEIILHTAKRELFEETGAKDFEIIPICVFSVKREEESFGMLFYANISQFTSLPETEIERIDFFQDTPNELSFPFIQPKLMDKVKDVLQIV